MSMDHGEEFEPILESFDQAWCEELSPPNIVDYLPPISDPDRVPLLVELIKIDMQWHSIKGHERKVEADYVTRFPELADHVKRLEELKDSEPRVNESRLETLISSSSQQTKMIPRPSAADLGSYRIAKTLGKGSMGIVYLARDLVLGRKVAIKVVRDDLLDPKFWQRFITEAEIVANLNHPGVVQVLELVMDHEPPFLVMEYLPNGTLKSRMKSGVPWDARLAADLVKKLADAVAAGHDARVVHRDLKPENILFDVHNQPKVTDFGLAKRVALDRTATHALIGTPAYMSPEQAMGQTELISPATDVWALGVILYELLSGNHPFDGESSEKLLNQIRLEEPRNLRKVNPNIPQDLETIVSRCLEKEIGARYQSAQELREELDRFLNHEPILARPASVAMRCRKWCRRHPVRAVLSVTTMLLILVLGTATFLLTRAYQRSREAEQAARQAMITAEKEEKHAKINEELARKMEIEATDSASLLINLFRTTDPLGIEDMGLKNVERPPLGVDDNSARLLLKASVNRIRKMKGTQSLSRANLLDALGNACRSRGLFLEAKKLLDEAYSIRKRLLGESHADIATSMYHLGRLAQDENRMTDAETLFQQALDMRRKVLGDEHRLVTVTLFSLAWATGLHFDVITPARRKKAERLLREVIRRQTEFPEGEHGDPFIVRMGLAILLYSHGEDRLAEAKSVMKDAAFSIRRSKLRDELVDCLNRYAKVIEARKRDQFVLATERLRAILPKLREVLGGDHFLVGYALMDLAGMLAKIGEFEEAEKEYRTALKIGERVFPGGNWLLVKAMMDAGANFCRYGRPDLAIEEYKRAMEMAVNVGHSDLWQQARAEIISLLKQQNRGEEAKTLQSLTFPTKVAK